MKRSAAQGLRTARRHYRRRNFTRVINFLEPQVFMYRDSPAYYHLLGMSCLHTGDFSGAYSYLRRALDIEEDADTMLGIAAVLLRRRNIDQALRTYLDVLDIDPTNRRARRALQWLRNLDQPEAAIDWFEDGTVRRIIPPIGFYLPRWITLPLLVLALGLLIALSWPLLRESARRIMAGDPREGSELLSTEDYESLIAGRPRDQNAGTPRFDLSEREARRLIEQIGEYFNAGRDNMVRREINRLALSNAAPALRERAVLVRDYLREPDFTNFDDNFSYDEVIADPALHDGVYVRWRGRIANLEIGDEAISFDMLVGYHDRRILDGIVPTTVTFAVLLENDQAVELIARVERAAESSDITLSVGSIRRLAPSEVEEGD